MSDNYEIFSKKENESQDGSRDGEKSENVEKKKTLNALEKVKLSLIAGILAACVVTMVFSVKRYVAQTKSNNDQGVVVITNSAALKTDVNMYLVEASGIASEDINKYFNNSETTAVMQYDTTVATSSGVTQNSNIPQTVSANTTSASTQNTTVSGLVNINTATKDELMKLSGIGEVKAQAIIDYRIENGYFSSVDELVNVNGIGEKTVEKNRDMMTVG